MRPQLRIIALRYACYRAPGRCAIHLERSTWTSVALPVRQETGGRHAEGMKLRQTPTSRGHGIAWYLREQLASVDYTYPTP